MRAPHCVYSLALLCALACFAGGCSKGNSQVNSPWTGAAKLKILTSITPLYCLTAHIAGEDAQVLCLMIAHGPHDFEPTSEDVKLLSEADLFIVNGLRLEGFLDGMVKNSDNRRLKVVHAGNAIPNERLLESEGALHYHGDKPVRHTGTDPHVWLGMEETAFLVDSICQALVDRDAQHAAGYKQRAQAVKERLQKVLEHRKSMPEKLNGGLVTFHDSFRYFGRSFKLDVVGTIRDVKGEQDTSPAAMREQAEEFRKKNVRVIGVEPQYPRGVALNLAKEIGPHVKIVDLDPLETGVSLPGEPYKIDKNYYFEKLEQNLQNLKKAFE